MSQQLIELEVQQATQLEAQKLVRVTVPTYFCMHHFLRDLALRFRWTSALVVQSVFLAAIVGTMSQDWHRSRFGFRSFDLPFAVLCYLLIVVSTYRRLRRN